MSARLFSVFAMGLIFSISASAETLVSLKCTPSPRQNFEGLGADIEFHILDGVVSKLHITNQKASKVDLEKAMSQLALQSASTFGFDTSFKFAGNGSASFTLDKTLDEFAQTRGAVKVILQAVYDIPGGYTFGRSECAGKVTGTQPLPTVGIDCDDRSAKLAAQSLDEIFAGIDGYLGTLIVPPGGIDGSGENDTFTIYYQFRTSSIPKVKQTFTSFPSKVLGCPARLTQVD